MNDKLIINMFYPTAQIALKIILDFSIDPGWAGMEWGWR